jgi:hypothetical protein
MIFRRRFKIAAYPSLFFGVLFVLGLGGQATAAALITNAQPNGSQGTLVQWDPYPYRPYPPGYHPPSQEPSGAQNVRPSGFIFIVVDPPDAAVFIDGNKVEPSKDNTYEEGVVTGMHKVVVKKTGYQDYLEIVTVSTGATQRLTIRLKPMK